MVYVYLQQYLDKVGAEPAFNRLPAVLRVPLSEPQFLLGALFVLFVFFAPGGIAGLVVRRRFRRASAATLLSVFNKP
jgi:branched-chain amino acid transport system permease protein